MKNVHAFKEEYYAPNNMAICLSGDIEPAETFKLIKEQWADMEPNKDLNEDRDHGKAEPINGPVTKTVQGPESERVYIGYRFPANDTAEQMVALIDELLYNGQAGLIDLNLVKEQKVLDGGCYSRFYREYGQLRFYGQARQDQELDEVKSLLLDQVEKIKNGDFPDWMMDAVIRNKKKERIENRSSNWKAFAFTNAFIKSEPWAKSVNYVEQLDQIKKKELVQFAKQHLDKDRVVVYKRHGEDTSAVEVPKPPISSVDINRSKKSEFRKQIEKIETKPIEPKFINYDKRISEKTLDNGLKLNYIENKENELFNLYYIVDIGRKHDKKLSLAMEYLEKLGTDRYSPSELEEEFYKLAADFRVSAGGKRSYVTVEGLKANFTETVKLLEHMLKHAKADTAAHRKMVDNTIQERKNRKKSKWANMSGLFSYGIYGANSGFSDKIPSDELRTINPQKLVNKIHNLYQYDHYMLYYGTREMNEVEQKLPAFMRYPKT